METLQKLAIPISIVIAGALIAAALYFVQNSGTQPNGLGTNTEPVEISGVSEDDHILGSPNADITIVEYSDTECPYCKQFHATLHQIIDEYGSDGTVAWVYRHFPIEQLHSKAPKQAEALECAAELGGNDAFWAYTDRIYEITPSNDGLDMALLPDVAEEVGLDRAAFISCLDSGRMAERVQSDYNEVVAAGGRGTPHNFVLVDNQQVPVEGAQSYQVMKGLIDAILNGN